VRLAHAATPGVGSFFVANQPSFRETTSSGREGSPQDAWFQPPKRSWALERDALSDFVQLAVSAVFTVTLACMTKHSCRAFADLGLTPDTGI
jgi:hypothetical protein